MPVASRRPAEVAFGRQATIRNSRTRTLKFCVTDDDTQSALESVADFPADKEHGNGSFTEIPELLRVHIQAQNSQPMHIASSVHPGDIMPVVNNSHDDQWGRTMSVVTATESDNSSLGSSNTPINVGSLCPSLCPSKCAFCAHNVWILSPTTPHFAFPGQTQSIKAPCFIARVRTLVSLFRLSATS